MAVLSYGRLAWTTVPVNGRVRAFLRAWCCSRAQPVTTCLPQAQESEIQVPDSLSGRGGGDDTCQKQTPTAHAHTRSLLSSHARAMAMAADERFDEASHAQGFFACVLAMTPRPSCSISARAGPAQHRWAAWRHRASVRYDLFFLAAEDGLFPRDEGGRSDRIQGGCRAAAPPPLLFQI